MERWKRKACRWYLNHLAQHIRALEAVALNEELTKRTLLDCYSTCSSTVSLQVGSWRLPCGATCVRTGQEGDEYTLVM